jgi:hypothetical protein
MLSPAFTFIISPSRERVHLLSLSEVPPHLYAINVVLFDRFLFPSII